MHDISHKRILFGILNWGLGHATRSSAVIIQLLKQHNTIEIASSGQAFHYLKNRFPQLVIHDLSGPEIIYASRTPFWMGILLQQAKITKGIKTETSFVNKHEKSFSPDLIISDNAYGFYSKTIPSILITHQLHIKSPFLENRVRKKIYNLLQPFSEVWIPDFDDEMNLSGQLSHPVLSDKKCTYIGPLTTFLKDELQVENKFEYCAVISGPEKQRTIFENRIIDFFNRQSKPCCIVRGITHGTKPTEKQLKSIHHIVDYAAGEQLELIMKQSNTIIARSGYSTIMDLYVLQKPCILFPTPGQTEQEYLFSKHFSASEIPSFSVSPKLISRCKG